MNSLRIDLKGKTVVVSKKLFPKLSVIERVFEVSGGFGCRPANIGSALIGEFLNDGEQAKVDGLDIERLATEDEIEQARAGSAGGV